jgi:hypothetical protein
MEPLVTTYYVIIVSTRFGYPFHFTSSTSLQVNTILYLPSDKKDVDLFVFQSSFSLLASLLYGCHHLPSHLAFSLGIVHWFPISCQSRYAPHLTPCSLKRACHVSTITEETCYTTRASLSGQSFLTTLWSIHTL